MRVRGSLLKLLAFAAVTLLVTSIVWTTLQNTVAASTYTYTARFGDASGLKEGDAVRIAGVQVGRVEAMSLVDNASAEVTFTADKEQRLFDGTRALIRYQNLVGQRFLALEPGDGGTRPLADGDSIRPDRTVSSLDLTTLLNGFEPLFAVIEPSQINRLSESLIKVFQGEEPSVGILVNQVAELTNRFADRDQTIGRVIDNVALVLGQLASKGPQVRDLITNTTQVVGALRSKLQPTLHALDGLSRLAGPVRGLLGELRPSIRDDVSSLRGIGDLLTRDMPTLERTVQAFPGFLSAVARAFGSGSWLNLYACTIDVNIPPIPSGVVKELPGHKHTEVCRS